MIGLILTSKDGSSVVGVRGYSGWHPVSKETWGCGLVKVRKG